MKKVSLFFCVLAAVALVWGAAPATVRAKSVSLNYANFPPAPTFPCVQMERWKTQIEKRTDGLLPSIPFPVVRSWGPRI